ncbi:MAG TPA: hypothetical protein VFV93_10215 [Thermomicrobiales bacterium]|nr:hypothetical protein [Thermomicrobiales bacterium]
MFTRRQAVDVTHLQQAGFTTEEIDQLDALRQTYPLIERVDSQREFQWLTFMRWCYVTGVIGE